jgi:hypothetical protein
MNEEYLINICRESLTQGSHRELNYLEDWFLDASNLSIL